MRTAPNKTITMQQALFSLRANNGKQLFTGVKRMGSSNTTLFTHTKDNSTEAKKTIRALPTVLQEILTEEDYRKIQCKVMGNTVAELTAVQ